MSRVAPKLQIIQQTETPEHSHQPPESFAKAGSASL
jgi:hypothetical protein